MRPLADYRDFTGSHPTKVFKATLFQSERLLLGLNCLEPGQEQHRHTHPGQDKFYYVIEGSGTFSVGEAVQTAGAGVTIWAPADVPHGVVNDGPQRLVLLVGIAPAPTG
jgi:quercetin dioxygenase-like cupin family protein